MTAPHEFRHEFHSVLPMKTFKVELSPKVESVNQPRHVFLTIAECKDLDDCIKLIHHDYPALQIDSISEVSDDTG